MTLVFEKMKILFGKLEYSFLVHYTLSKEKTTLHETAQPKAAVKSLNARSAKRTHQKQRLVLKNKEVLLKIT